MPWLGSLLGISLAKIRLLDGLSSRLEVLEKNLLPTSLKFLAEKLVLCGCMTKALFPFTSVIKGLSELPFHYPHPISPELTILRQKNFSSVESHSFCISNFRCIWLQVIMSDFLDNLVLQSTNMGPYLHTVPITRFWPSN